MNKKSVKKYIIISFNLISGIAFIIYIIYLYFYFNGTSLSFVKNFENELVAQTKYYPWSNTMIIEKYYHNTKYQDITIKSSDNITIEQIGCSFSKYEKNLYKIEQTKPDSSDIVQNNDKYNAYVYLDGEKISTGNKIRALKRNTQYKIYTYWENISHSEYEVLFSNSNTNNIYTFEILGNTEDEVGVCIFETPEEPCFFQIIYLYKYISNNQNKGIIKNFNFYIE
ncbi:MAG: hypothetical protein IJ756_09025 [Paludibacteraceae bacterium]|nr:hypothetical protein [Paludibacteraceae bacterium]